MYGDLSGQAINLSFQQPVQPEKQPEKQPEYSLEAPKRIALDAAALEGEYYGAIYDMKEVFKNYYKQGIDFSKPPNPADPVAFQAYTRFKSHQQEVELWSQKLAQAYDLQKMLLKAELDGSAYVNSNVFDQGREQPIGFEDASRSFWNEQAFVRDVNNKLLEKPTTQEQLQDQMAQYQEALDVVRMRGEAQGLEEPKIREIQARIRKPAHFSEEIDPLTKAKIDTEKARAKEVKSRAYLNYQKGKEYNAVVHPYVQETATLLRDTIEKMEGSPDQYVKPIPTKTKPSKAIAFQGDKDIVLDEIITNGDGRGKLVFKPSNFEDLNRKIEEGEIDISTIKVKNGMLEVDFDRQNLLPVYSSLLSPASFYDFYTNEMPKLDIMDDGKMSLEQILKASKARPLDTKKANKKKSSTALGEKGKPSKPSLLDGNNGWVNDLDSIFD